MYIHMHTYVCMCIVCLIWWIIFTRIDENNDVLEFSCWCYSFLFLVYFLFFFWFIFLKYFIFFFSLFAKSYFVYLFDCMDVHIFQNAHIVRVCVYEYAWQCLGIPYIINAFLFVSLKFSVCVECVWE